MNQEIYQTVKLYLENKLPEIERQTFEERYEQDEEFAKEVDEYSTMQSVIQGYGDQKLNEDLTVLGKSLMAAQNEGKRETKVISFGERFAANRNMWFAAAAVILLLIIVVPLLPGTKYTPEGLYGDHFQTPSIGEVRGEEGEEELWKQVVTAYTSKDYQNAASLIQQGLNDSVFTRPSEAYLYLGISQMAQENLPNALEAFDKISPGSESSLKARWYQALTYLKMNNLDKSKVLLDEIIADPSDDAEKKAAQNLLDKFDKIDPS